MNFPIDVIIPTYNRAICLIRAINSVLAQTYQNFNLYIIDDGSIDETQISLAPFLQNSQVHYLKQDNKGVSAARNLGIKSSHSEWIAFLDSDDEWLPEKLSIQVNFIQKNPGHRFIHTNEYWYRNGVRVNPKIKFDKSNVDIFKRSLATCLISPSTTLIKRELIIEQGLFNEEFIICEDYDLWLKILSQEEVGFLPDYLIIKHGGRADQLSTMYPAMDYWRIRSMVNLTLRLKLNPEKRAQVLAEINQKTPNLLAGLLKYNHLDKHHEVQIMLDRLKSLQP